MGSYVKYSHCSYCGARYSAESDWPRRCAQCNQTTWLNPLPVAVAVVPVDDGGVLAVRRNINPGKGGVTLPGGFMEYGETWQQALVRELAEETNVRVDASRVTLLTVETSYPHASAYAPPEGTVLIFGVTQPVARADIFPFTPNHETAELLILPHPIELIFSTHSNALRYYFSSRVN